MVRGIGCGRAWGTRRRRKTPLAVPPSAWILLLGGIGLGIVSAGNRATFAEDPAATNLLRCPAFSPQGALRPDQVWSALQPTFPAAAIQPSFEEKGVVWASPDRPFAVGAISQRIEQLQGGRSYLLELRGTAWNLSEAVQATVLARVTFLRQGRPLHPAGVLARECQVSAADADAAAFTLRDVFAAPEDADAAEISLEVKWLRGGRV
ncbi:MAG: hypothetical protein GYA33_02095, partial [Thermogutta sp.]|nr:hypothetical protein [Thermogutta sp.]